jgi:imidazole glycerol-phosphate synthase subunit HisF
MLKVRVIPTLLYRDGGLVKGTSFDSWRPVGSPMQSIRVYNLREVDELVLVDITATREQRDPDFDAIDGLADYCFMPLTVGGGVRSLAHVRRLLQVGADKVALNTAAVENPTLIREIADRFGSQCVVVSIDAKRVGDAHRVFTHSGTQATELTVRELARKVEQMGAGEILVTSTERDGTMTGYDLDLIREVSEAVSIPVIAGGGAGSYADMLAAIKDGGASAVAAAAMFHFTQHTPREAKQFLASHGVPVRL